MAVRYPTGRDVDLAVAWYSSVDRTPWLATPTVIVEGASEAMFIQTLGHRIRSGCEDLTVTRRATATDEWSRLVRTMKRYRLQARPFVPSLLFETMAAVLAEAPPDPMCGSGGFLLDYATPVQVAVFRTAPVPDWGWAPDPQAHPPFDTLVNAARGASE
jgi:hypothetical protein